MLQECSRCIGGTTSRKVFAGLFFASEKCILIFFYSWNNRKIWFNLEWNYMQRSSTGFISIIWMEVLNARFVNFSHILVLAIWKKNLVKGVWSPWRIILIELFQPMKNLLSIKNRWESMKVIANFLLRYWVFSMFSSLCFQQNQQIFCQQMLQMFAQRKKEKVKSTANIFCFITSFVLLQSEQI